MQVCRVIGGGDLKSIMLTYDPEYDKELDALIESTPKGRKSERLRYLIRLGLLAERQGVAISSPRSAPKEEFYAPPTELSAIRKIGRFQPPD